MIPTPFEIGGVYWLPKTAAEKQNVSCPVCKGTRVVVLLLGEDRAVVDCEACGLGCDKSRGYVEIYNLTPGTEQFIVASVVSMHDGRYRLRSETGAEADFNTLVNTEEEALIVSKAKCAEQHERNMESFMLKRRSAKRSTWSVAYHKKCITDLEKQIAWHQSRIHAKSL